MAAVAVTAAIVNLAIKPLSRRARPDREEASVPARPPGQDARVPLVSLGTYRRGVRIREPGRGGRFRGTTAPLSVLATLVGYSRVHTGVHYPLDVIVGALCGVSLATVSDRALNCISSG